MPTLKGTEASLSCVQCFLYLVSFSINVSIFHSVWLDTFQTHRIMYGMVLFSQKVLLKNLPEVKKKSVVAKNTIRDTEIE